MAGEEERHHLVPHQLGRHAFIRCRIEQQRKQSSSSRAGGRGDEATHRRIDAVDGPSSAKEGRETSALEPAGTRQQEERKPSREEPELRRERRGIVFDICAKKRLHHDGERQLIHGGADVYRRAAYPPIGEPGRETRYLRSLRRNLSPGERRLDAPPLRPVQLPFTREQAVSEQPAGALHESPLSEELGVIHEDALHLVRVGQEERVGAAEPEPRDVALSAGEVEEEAGGVGVEPGCVADEREAAGPEMGGDAADGGHADSRKRQWQSSALPYPGAVPSP
jgi:hypothetical protein